MRSLDSFDNSKSRPNRLQLEDCARRVSLADSWTSFPGRIDLHDNQFVCRKGGGQDAHDLREALPPPCRLLTTSSGVINAAFSRAVDGTLHSAISQTVSTVKVTFFPVGKYSA